MTARASSRRSPTRSCAPSSTSTCPPSAGTRSAWRSCPIDDAERAELEERRRGASPTQEGLARARLARRAHRPRAPRHPGPRGRAGLRAAVRRLDAHRRRTAAPLGGIALDRQAFRLRKRAERELGAYFPSLSAARSSTRAWSRPSSSSRSTPTSATSASSRKLALVHSRYSTNTFPSWPLAQPFRMIAHNGEINTVQGNRNWMRARQSQLESRAARRPAPAVPDRDAEGASDSASFDEVVELLTLARPLAAARDHDDGAGGVGEPGRHRPRPRGVLRVPLDAHGAVGRPGRARLHRRLARRRDPRPQRPASRPLPGDRRRSRRARERDRRARLPRRPDRAQGPAAPRARCSSSTPPRGASSRTTRSRRELAAVAAVAASGSSRAASTLADLPEREHIVHTPASVTRRQRTFGYTEEEVRILIRPMAQNGAEPLGAMGSDTPIAVL